MLTIGCQLFKFDIFSQSIIDVRTEFKTQDFLQGTMSSNDYKVNFNSGNNSNRFTVHKLLPTMLIETNIKTLWNLNVAIHFGHPFHKIDGKVLHAVRAIPCVNITLRNARTLEYKLSRVRHTTRPANSRWSNLHLHRLSIKVLVM